ncbi:hypothetical protein M0R88_13310 [Halorussus gelatinilyticus]|uniref:DUF7321 domain-containing protein n=1 Tax=Halorussus gelatinilyticus TaxID=2937524 RepID=A0A8U0IGS5_9EURY|nr:hypothetical protein [Halorussus gelatinilyticus]UPV99493.1 hypothetical protein M0R88_13310 [Halorussus gelatinilyticus]
MASETLVAAGVALVVTASFPFYLYGAWYILDQEVVTWDVLMHHLKFITVGLLLTTVPLLGWMLPRFFEQIGGFAALHAFLGLQAYAMLLVALTGIVRIFQVKYQHDMYDSDANDRDVDIGELHENMGAWRGRLRVGVVGYVLFWILAWVVGMVRFFIDYVLY